MNKLHYTRFFIAKKGDPAAMKKDYPLVNHTDWFFLSVREVRFL